MNKFVGVGRLTRDVELKHTGGGHAVANFTLAVNRRFKGENGEYEADFLNCVAWRGTAEAVANYVKKGQQLAVEGSVQTRSYDNNEGKKVYVTEILVDNVTFIDNKQASKQTSSTASVLDEGVKIDINSDELPF